MTAQAKTDLHTGDHSVANANAQVNKFLAKAFSWKFWLAYILFAGAAHIYIEYFMPASIGSAPVIGDVVFYGWAASSAIMFGAITVMMWVLAYKLMGAQAANPNLAGWQSFLVVAFIVTMSFVIPGAKFWEMLKYLM